MKTSTRVSAILAMAVSVIATISFGADVTDQIQYFANPAKHYFPKSDITNMAARCCRCIKAINGRLYIGMGDYTYNTGPTPVVALSPTTGAFTNEYSAGTEAIDDFKVFSNGKVYVPSLDPREGDSRIGHFFIRSSTVTNATWSLNKKIPKGVADTLDPGTYIYTHCWDLAEFGGKIHFAGYGTASATFSGGTIGTFSDTCPDFEPKEWEVVLQWFENLGEWQYYTRSKSEYKRLYSFLEVDGVLYAVRNSKFAPGHDGSPVTSWDGVTYNTSDTYLFRYCPETGLFSRETNAWSRILPSTGLNDALFTDRGDYYRPMSTSMIVERTLKSSAGKSYYIATLKYRPLGVYRATISSADGKLSSQKISLGANTWPADIIEADGKVRILAFSFDGSSTTNIVNKVFESSDGETFAESFRFNHRQIAASFECLDNTYYFGFGMTGCTSFTHEAAANYVMSTDHNGEIWKYDTSSQPDDPPGPGPDDPPGPGPDDPPDPPDPGVEADHWTYDSAAGTISDGIWTFNATVSSGNMLTVGTCNAYPDSVSRLDFAKPVQGAGETEYTIKVLNTAMVTFSRDGGRPEESTDKGMAAMVGELRLPATGLTSIGEGAFCRTVNCTNVVNYLPDSVTTLGRSAFAYCGAKQDLFLRGFSGKTGRGVFYSCGIKSITFGPGFKGIGDTSNKMASFQGCSSITNVVFDPAGSGISLDANAFQCRPTLTQPLVLYGVTSVASSAFTNWKIPSITFDNGIESIGSLTSVTTLTEVRFLGAPLASQTGAWADYNQGTVTVATYVPYEFRQQWWEYAAGYDASLSSAQKETLIKIEGTTFSSVYATNPDKRPLLLSSMPSVPVPQPVFSGAGAKAPRIDAQGRFVMSIGNAVAGGRYRLYATTSLSEPFEPVGEAVTAMADGVLEFAIDTNGAPSMFVKVVAE